MSESDSSQSQETSDAGSHDPDPEYALLDTLSKLKDRKDTVTERRTTEAKVSTAVCRGSPCHHSGCGFGSN